MTENSLFLRLAKYRGRPNKESIENFFTELVGQLLQEEKALRTDFVQFLRGGAAAKTDYSEIRTQFPTVSKNAALRGLLLDLVLLKPQHDQDIIIVENKIGSPLYPQQLDNYLRYSQEVNGEVAAISKYPDPVAVSDDPRFLGNFLWSDIAKRWATQKDVTNRYLLEGVLTFMRRYEMGALEPFRQDELPAGHLFRSFQSKAKALVSAAYRRADSVRFLNDFAALKVRHNISHADSFLGTLWSAPAKWSPGDCDFWYFLGFTYGYPEWYLAPLTKREEPECVVFVGMWPSSSVQELSIQVHSILPKAITDTFEVTETKNRRGLVLCHRRSVTEFLDDTDGQTDGLLQFLVSADKLLTDNRLVPTLFKLLRKASPVTRGGAEESST
jgi:hypothetical protein